LDGGSTRDGQRWRGRGAVSNPAGRFEPRDVVPLDDDVWWAVDPEAERVPTTLTADRARTILTRNDSPDVPFRLSINPYRGCEHGCTYCFARPTHSYLGLSPGLDFETRIFFKADAPALLERELARRSYVPEPIALGANTDAYQPAERELRLTRGVLEVLARAGNPVAAITKASLVLRDLDLLAPMAERGQAKVMVSITTLDDDLARSMEPRAASPARRLRTLEALSAAGVPTGVLVSPIVPGLTDHELEAILDAAADAGARSANFIVLRLPHELRELFGAWLRRAAPTRAERVLARVRDLRGGDLYDASFGRRMTGTGPWADLLARRFRAACARLGLARRTMPMDVSRFRRPGGQGVLFGPGEDGA
jgi:DNA repair photolyase